MPPYLLYLAPVSELARLVGQFFEELRRRNVYKVGIAYVIASWLLVQAADLLVPILQLPEWVPPFIVLLLAIGLIPALIFAWAYEMTPEGLKRDKDVDRSKSITKRTGRKLDFVIIGALSVALVGVVWNSHLRSPAEEPPSDAAPEPALEASIAVLPFLNMSSDPDQEYFADGMTEEILNTLAAIKDLRVAGRTSSFMFKERTDVDFQTIGEMLNVAYVLEGSVRKSGNTLRITAQLIAAESGYHLWSKTYDRELADIFDIQDELATAIGEEMQLTLGVEVAESIAHRKLTNEEALEIWLRGLAALRSGQPAEALQAFETVIAMEPEYLPGYRLKANALASSFYLGFSDEESFFDEVQGVLRALMDLAPDSKERYFVMATILDVQRDWQGLADVLQKIADMDNDPVHLLLASNAAWILGQNEKSLQLGKKYLELEPLHHGVRRDYAIDLATYGRRAEAAIEIAKLVKMAPEDSATINAKANFHSYFDNNLAEGIKWWLLQRDAAEVGVGLGAVVAGLLLDLGDDTAAQAWLDYDLDLARFATFHQRTEYFLARYDDNSELALALARQFGESRDSLSIPEEYIAEFDWLRLLQRDDPAIALELYSKTAPQLTTDEPTVFDIDMPLAISLADLYLQTGKSKLANRILDQCLASLISNPDHYARPSKTMIYALKGDVPNALQSLRESIDANWRWEWWLLEKDLAYSILWDEPKFHAMMDELREDMARQRAELHAMIESGEIDLSPNKNSE